MSSLEEYASYLQSDSSCISSEALKLVASECGIDEKVVDFVLENTQGDVRMAAESLRQMRGGLNVPSEEQTASAEKRKVPTTGAGLHDMRKITIQALVAQQGSELVAAANNDSRSSCLQSSEYVHDDTLGKAEKIDDSSSSQNEAPGENITPSNSAENSDCGNVLVKDDVANFIQKHAIDSIHEPEPELVGETSPPFTPMIGLPTGVTPPQSQELNNVIKSTAEACVRKCGFEMYLKDRTRTNGGPGSQDILMFLHSEHVLYPYYLFLKENARRELEVVSPTPASTRQPNVSTVNERTLAIKKILGFSTDDNNNDKNLL